MNTQQLVPLMMAFNTPPRERQQMLQLMLPSLLDVDPDLRPLLGGLAGKQILQRCRQRERAAARDLVRELPKALKVLEKKESLDDAALQELPVIREMGLKDEVERLFAQISGGAAAKAAAPARGGARKG